MNLYRKKIAGWDTFVDEATSGVFPYLAAETNPDTNLWDDITSIENWDAYGKHTNGDALFVKNEIKTIFDAKAGVDEAAKWANCNTAEKTILAMCWSVDASRIAEVFPDGNVRKYYYGELVKASIPARQARIEKCIVYFGEELASKAERVDLYNTVKTSVNSYVSSGDNDLIDYINSSGAYTPATGFESKTYYTVALRDLFNLIVRDGLI